MPTRKVEDILETARKRLDLTWEELAGRIGVTDGYLHQIKTGLRTLRKKRDLWIHKFELTEKEADELREALDFTACKPEVQDRITRLEKRAERHAAALEVLVGIVTRSDIKKLLTKGDKESIAAILKSAD